MPHHTVAKYLAIAGALNWGIIGITTLSGEYLSIGGRFDVIEYISGTLLSAPLLASVIYVVIGIAAGVALLSLLNRSV